MTPNNPLPSHALCPWYAGYRINLIHPADLDRLAKISPHGRVFKVIEPDETYLKIAYGTETFRVKPELLRALPPPEYELHQKVIRERDNSAAEIADIIWHEKESRPFYHITIEGKRLRRRYWADELQPENLHT